MNLFNAAKTLGLWLDPLRQALFARDIPFSHRWRLLILQQLNFIIYPIKTIPWTFSRAYRIIWLPSRGEHTLRALVFEPQGTATSKSNVLRPLHIDFHSGAFAGGIAEVDNAWCWEVCRRTGAVVVSVDYRLAPQHTYPAAHEDCEDAVSWLLEHAREHFNADPDCLTVSGFSAGANLMFVARTRARAAVGLYAPIDLRLPPLEKPKSGNFPKNDPMAVLLPLYDSYASPARQTHMHDARMNPIIAPLEDLPSNVLLIVAGIDICVHEQLTFVDRAKTELRTAGLDGERTIEAVVLDKVFHGWFELPYLPKDLHEEKINAQDMAVEFILKAQRRQAEH